MSFVSDVFLTERNLFNITRNFAFFGIMALGMSAVICTAGIDLSVGSLMALSGITLGLVMQAGYGIELGFAACMLTAAAVGFVNGVLVAYVRLAPFVVTLGMLAIARSLAMVISNNKMIYEFGPDQDLFEWIGGESVLGVPNVVWVLIIMTILFWWVWRNSTWGRWVLAIGGNADAAKLSGIPVERVVVSVYMVCSLCTGLAAFMFVGYTGSVTNGIGVTQELNVIAASVIGTPDEIMALDHDEARALHAVTHRPENATLVIIGGVTGREARRALREAGWREAQGERAELAPPPFDLAAPTDTTLHKLWPKAAPRLLWRRVVALTERRLRFEQVELHGLR